MIKLIGLKRLVVLVCVIALNLLALGVYLFSVGPMLSNVQMRQNSLNGEISGLRGRISAVRMDTAYLKKNLPKYTALQQSGFFTQQNRFTIKSAMEDMRVKAGISNFAYSVGKVHTISNADAAAIHYKLIASEIVINHIVSPLDSNIYLLAQDMGQSFPSFVRLEEMDVHRTKKVDAESLKAIAEGKPVSFVGAALTFESLALVPNPPAATGSAAGGFRGQ